MSNCTVRIKNQKTGEHMMVTPEYASKTKMLKNSGWLVESQIENKEEVLLDKTDQKELEQVGEDEFSDKKEAFLSKQELETGKEFIADIVDENQTVDVLEQKEEAKQDNKPLEYVAPNTVVEQPKRRGRQPGSKNKSK